MSTKRERIYIQKKKEAKIYNHCMSLIHFTNNNISLEENSSLMAYKDFINLCMKDIHATMCIPKEYFEKHWHYKALFEERLIRSRRLPVVTKSAVERRNELREERLRRWIGNEKQKADNDGELFFMGVPDKWYEPVHYCCINGHVSNTYLKSEALGRNVCLACQESIFICPEITEKELSIILNIE